MGLELLLKKKFCLYCPCTRVKKYLQTIFSLLIFNHSIFIIKRHGFFCGNKLPTRLSDHCNHHCTGDKSKICGGWMALSVFSTGYFPPMSCDCWGDFISCKISLNLIVNILIVNFR